MEHSRKMALVPQELLSTIQAKQQEQTSPLVKTAVTLDEEMKSVMERPDLPDDEKATLYQQLLQRYLTYRDKRRTEPVTVRVLSSPTTVTNTATTDANTDGKSPSTPVSSGKEDQSILEAFPKTMKARARQMLNVIKHKGGDIIGYNDQGQLLYNKQVVPGSNVSDLIRDAMQKRQGFNPTGWQSFARGLARINAPEAAIRHPTRLSVIQRHKSRTARGEDLSDGESEDVIPTPQPKRRRVVAQRLPGKKRKVGSAGTTPSTKRSFSEMSWT